MLVKQTSWTLFKMPAQAVGSCRFRPWCVLYTPRGSYRGASPREPSLDCAPDSTWIETPFNSRVCFRNSERADVSFEVVVYILALSMEARQRRWKRRTPSCCARIAAWRKEKATWKPELLWWGQQFNPKAAGGPEAARSSLM